MINNISEYELNITTEQLENMVKDGATKEYVQEQLKSLEVGGVVVDSELDTESENPVMNKVVAKAVEELNSKVNGESGATESLVFEHSIENHSTRTVTAIDFENFTMTLDDVSEIPTDTSGKVQSYIQLELFGGNVIKANVMPIELITKPFKVQSVGDNKVKLLDSSNNVIQFTDTGNIDVTKFKLCVSETPFSIVNVNNLDTTHKYRVELDFNGFHHFTAGIKLPEMASDSNGGYAINGIASRPNSSSVHLCAFNKYLDTISLRDITEGAGSGATSCLPVKFMVVLTPELYEGRKRTLVQTEITWFGYNTTKYNFINSVAYATGWANNAITQLGVESGNLGWLGNSKLKVYDCGEVEL